MPFNRSDIQMGKIPYGTASTSLIHQGVSPSVPNTLAPPTDISMRPPTRVPQSSLSEGNQPSSGGMPAKVSLVADNQRHGEDPTSQGPVHISDSKPSNKFDELYTKVLRETDGALNTAKGDVNISAGGLSNRSEKGLTSQGDYSLHSSKSGPKPAQRGEPRSNKDNTSIGSLGKEQFSPRKSIMSEIEYSQDFDGTQSDISDDIENIQDINDLLPPSPMIK